MEPLDNPLKYIDDILFHDGLREFMNTFKNNSELISKGFNYIEEEDCYMSFTVIDYDDDRDSSPSFEFINRDTFLKEFLNENKKSLYLFFKQKESVNEFSDVLRVTYNHLHSYIKKAAILDSPYSDIINAHLIELIKDIRILFPVIESHKVFKFLNINTELISFFKYKDLKASFFEDLYRVTYQLNLIDDVEVSEETFYDVFTTNKPNTEQKIRFIEKNHLVAFYLKEIEPFFNNLNSVTIESSKCFINKQGKPITSSDLYTSLSRNKGKNLDDLKKIKLKIDELKRTYLK